MNWFILAWLNLGRNRRRTLASLVLTAMAVVGIMNTSGFALYTLDSLRDFSMRSQGHVVLSHARFFSHEEESPLQYGLEDHQGLKASLEADPGIQQALASLSFSGLISNGDKSTIYLGQGIEPEAMALNGLASGIQAGQSFTLNPDPMADPEIILGSGLAASLGASPGSLLTLLATTGDGVLNALDVQVVAVVSSGTPEIDARLVLTPLYAAQELLMTDKVSQLGVYLNNSNQDQQYYQLLRQQYPTLGVTSWETLAHYYSNVRDLYSRIFGVLGGILLIMVAFAIFNTASMSVLERTNEIGTLSALGTYRGEVLLLLLLEAALLALAGGVIGLLISGAMSLGLNLADIPMPPAPGQTETYPLKAYWSPVIALSTLAAVALMAMAAALLASLKTLRKPIVEALQHA